jgi:hypothetical protein
MNANLTPYMAEKIMCLQADHHVLDGFSLKFWCFLPFSECIFLLRKDSLRERSEKDKEFIFLPYMFIYSRYIK